MHLCSDGQILAPFFQMLQTNVRTLLRDDKNGHGPRVLFKLEKREGQDKKKKPIVLLFP